MNMHFRVDGEFLTHFFRQRVLEGAWREAMTGMQDSICGITLEQIVDILSGKSRLIGSSDDDDGIILEPDPDASEYLKECNFHFGHLWNDGGVWWEPYAQVTSYGRNDLFKFGCKMTGAERPLHYADSAQDMAKDLQIPEGETLLPRGVLFRKVMPPPLWWKGKSTAQEAVDALMSVRGLEERGHDKWYPAEPSNDESTDALHRVEKRFSKGAVSRVRTRHELVQNPNDRKERIEAYRERIVEQAGGDYIEHDFGGDVGAVSIPRAPLVYWALWRTHAKDLLPEWNPVCPRGMKMFGHDPYHTDWMVGAGIDLDAYDSSEFRDQCFDLMRDVQKTCLGFDVTILVSGKPHAVGETVHPKPSDRVPNDKVAVIPNAGPKYYEAVKGAAGVIVQKGGAMSHLAVVGLEEGFLIVRDPKALNRYPPGILLAINAKDGTIDIMATV